MLHGPKYFYLLETDLVKDAALIVCAWQRCCVNIGSTQSTRWLQARSLFTDVQSGLTGEKLLWNPMLNVFCLLVSNTHLHSDFTGAVRLLDREENGRQRGDWSSTKENFFFFFLHRLFDFRFLSLQGFPKTMTWKFSAWNWVLSSLQRVHLQLFLASLRWWDRINCAFFPLKGCILCSLIYWEVLRPWWD